MLSWLLPSQILKLSHPYLNSFQKMYIGAHAMKNRKKLHSKAGCFSSHMVILLFFVSSSFDLICHISMTGYVLFLCQDMPCFYDGICPVSMTRSVIYISMSGYVLFLSLKVMFCSYDRICSVSMSLCPVTMKEYVLFLQQICSVSI